MHTCQVERRQPKHHLFDHFQQIPPSSKVLLQVLSPFVFRESMRPFWQILQLGFELIPNHNQPVTATASLIGKSKRINLSVVSYQNGVKYRYVKHECDEYPPTKTNIYPYLGKRKTIFKHTQGVQDMLVASKGMYFGSWFIWTFPSEIPSPRRTWPEEKRCERA